MKKMAWVLSALLLVSTTLPAQAAPETLQPSLQETLVQRGYPPEVLDQMSQENMQALEKSQASYRSHTYAEASLSDKSDAGADPSRLSNFRHLIVVSQVPPGAPDRTDLLVTYDWCWDYQPIFTLTDKFGLAWSGDFELLTDYPNAATYGYTAYGTDVETGRRYDTLSFQWNGQDQYTPGNGIGWSYDILGDFWSNRGGRYRQYEVYRHRGWAQLRMGQYANGRQQQSAVAGRYFHQQMQGNGSLQFNTSGPPSVNITSSWAYDESNTATTSFHWPS